jgi:membrane protease YdiL (CAAX protease family)
MPAVIAGAGWARFLVGFAVLYGTLAGLAGIDATGRLGLPILAGVLLVAVVVERALDGTGPVGALRALGFGRPGGRSLLVALVVSVPVLVVPATVVGVSPELRPGWPWLLLGIFAFHGLAEEVVWRGYAYRRLRAGRSFGRAVVATMPLVAAAHLPIVVGSGLAVGAAALVVAAATAIPLAHLWELGRGTIWAPALLHTAIDAFKLVVLPPGSTLAFSLALAAVSATVPLLVLVVPISRRPRRAAASARAAAAPPARRPRRGPARTPPAGAGPS